jgi:hypothetical protein
MVRSYAITGRSFVDGALTEMGLVVHLGSLLSSVGLAFDGMVYIEFLITS